MSPPVAEPHWLWGDWECPCAACNGGPAPEFECDREEMFEPEHPENVSPEREGFDHPQIASRE